MIWGREVAGGVELLASSRADWREEIAAVRVGFSRPGVVREKRAWQSWGHRCQRGHCRRPMRDVCP